MGDSSVEVGGSVVVGMSSIIGKSKEIVNINEEMWHLYNTISIHKRCLPMNIIVHKIW